MATQKTARKELLNCPMRLAAEAGYEEETGGAEVGVMEDEAEGERVLLAPEPEPGPWSPPCSHCA